MPQIPASDTKRSATKQEERVYCRLIHPAALGEQLRGIPHKTYLDMELVYYRKIAVGKRDFLTMFIDNEQMDRWKISENELEKLAWDNTCRDQQAELKPMCEVLKEMGVQDARVEDSLYVLSNREKELGAVVLFYPDMQEKIAREIGSDYYVIPSSIHECLILKCDGTVEADFLQNLLIRINREELQPRDVLSNSIYRYTGTKKKLVIDKSGSL